MVLAASSVFILMKACFFPFQDQEVGDLPKGKSQGNDVTLSDITGKFQMLITLED